MTASPLLIARAGETDLFLLSNYANRHGLITGATGTGKTVTLQRMAEQFSSLGVPVFMADLKGDLSGIGAAGTPSEKLMARLKALGITSFTPEAAPVTLWDVFGTQGHPVRATISDMGPLLLARLLNLNDTQAGVLQLVFKIADDNGLLLIDLKDLRKLLQYVGDNAKTFTTEYGNISAASIGAIQRNLLGLEAQGGEIFFGEPMLNIADLIQTDAQGKGMVNVLAADKLFLSPKLYATFLLWLLSELFEALPEVGDADKPKIVFFFDEAHLLFDDAPEALIEKVEQVVRLIRSKGVGVYFVTQNPLDIPDKILGQLGNRVQHALRAFTPRDQKAVKTAAETMRANPAFDTEAAIIELGVGEALVSFLDEKGSPRMVERGFVIAPNSRLGPLTTDERAALIRSSVLYDHYEQREDRESAFEQLTARAGDAPVRPTSSSHGSLPFSSGRSSVPASAPAQAAPQQSAISQALFGYQGPRGGQHDGLVQAAAKSVVRSIGSTLGREIMRGILGSVVGGRRR